jgi:hypothetical protein
MAKGARCNLGEGDQGNSRAHHSAVDALGTYATFKGMITYTLLSNLLVIVFRMGQHEE